MPARTRSRPTRPTTAAWPPPAAALAPPSGPPVAQRPPRRWPTRLATVVLVAVAAGVGRGALLVVPILFVLVVPFEKLFPRHQQQLRRPQLGTDVVYGLAAPALQAAAAGAGIVIGLASLAWLPGAALRPVVLALPPLVRTVAGVLLLDLVSYWTHRFSHEVPFLWRFHAVHHSTVHLDWVSGLRNHPLDGAFAAPGYVLLAVAGFPLELVGALAAVQFVTGLFLHANVRWRWRVLQRIVITPEFHHWHHADQTESRFTNYATLLPLWDIVFGTYRVPTDRRPMRYGIGEPMPTGLVNQLRYPLRGLPRMRSLARRAVCHPLHSARALARAVRQGIGEMWASARRPTRSFVHSPG